MAHVLQAPPPRLARPLGLEQPQVLTLVQLYSHLRLHWLLQLSEQMLPRTVFLLWDW